MSLGVPLPHVEVDTRVTGLVGQGETIRRVHCLTDTVLEASVVARRGLKDILVGIQSLEREDFRLAGTTLRLEVFSSIDTTDVLIPLTPSRDFQSGDDSPYIIAVSVEDVDLLIPDDLLYLRHPSGIMIILIKNRHNDANDDKEN